MNRSELGRIARAMVMKNKGILAADESTSTITKRFAGIKLESTEEQRRSYREMLFTAPGSAAWISGVILYDETLRQKTRDGVAISMYPVSSRAAMRSTSRWPTTGQIRRLRIPPRC